MIRIRKPTEIPDILLHAGQEATENNINQFEQFSAEYLSGERKFEFEHAIYGDESVKESLRHAQHGKCCFCERKEEIGDVEHYRPKSGYRQQRGGKRSQTGYYWLAYDWDNLLFCCPKCNRRYKENLFPLLDPSKRAVSHHDDIRNEEPLFIHPADENPEEFIEYKGIHPRAINGNIRGMTTIRETGIDRPFLDERRFALYTILKQIYFLLQSSLESEKRLQLQQLLDEAAEESAEFASMIRCAIRDEFRF